MNRIIERLSSFGVVPVVALDHSCTAASVAKALIAGGLPCAEITFRTAAAEESIHLIKAAISDPGHFVCHDYARDTIRRYFESTCSSIEEKWALYENLCSSHMSMTEIQSGIFKPDVYMWR